MVLTERARKFECKCRILHHGRQNTADQKSLPISYELPASENLGNGCGVSPVDGVLFRGFGNGTFEPVSSPIDTRTWDDP